MAMIEAKTQAIQRGEGDIKVSMEGVEPAVELLLWEITKKIQIRANEVASEYMLGVS